MKIWKDQPQRIKLRKTKKPCEKGFLSGVALYKENKTTTHHAIEYTPPTARMLANKMPMGIGPAHPAYIYVNHIQNVYRVYCCYLNEDYCAHLWTQVDKPAWL